MLTSLSIIFLCLLLLGVMILVSLIIFGMVMVVEWVKEKIEESGYFPFLSMCYRHFFYIMRKKDWVGRLMYLVPGICIIILLPLIAFELKKEFEKEK